MSGAGLPYGLNISKKTLPGSKAAPVRRKALFDDDGSDEDGNSGANGVEEIGEFGGLESIPPKSKSAPGSQGRTSSGPTSKIGIKSKKAPISMYGDLSTDFSSKKHAETAEELDAGIYDYDAVYDSMKPQKKIKPEDAERKPKYMSNLIAAAEVRKRDATIAEEKKLAREREAEGDEYADKEKFVTSAYMRQQEENRRIEEEEKRREEEEMQKNKGKGFTGFYKSMLDRGEQKHAEIVKATEERVKEASLKVEDDDAEDEGKAEARLAHEINEKHAGAIAVNDEGEVVDKRQLLKGGLNVAAKPKVVAQVSALRHDPRTMDRNRGSGMVGAGGGRQAMRERQTRMLEAQLEAASKRAYEDEEAEREKVERASKSRKTESDIMSAKERYLARKREQEEANNKGDV